MVDRVGYERDAFISTLSRLRAASSTMYQGKAAPHVSSVHRELMASIAASQLGHSAPLRNYCLLPDVRGAQVSPIGRGRVPARHEIVLDVSLDAALPFGAPQAALERALAELAARCGEQGASSEPVQCTDVAIDNSPTEEIRRQITLELQCAPSSAWTTQLPRSLSPSQALLPPQHLLQLPLQEQQNLSQWPHRRHLSLQQHPAPPPIPLYQLPQQLPITSAITNYQLPITDPNYRSQLLYQLPQQPLQFRPPPNQPLNQPLHQLLPPQPPQTPTALPVEEWLASQRSTMESYRIRASRTEPIKMTVDASSSRYSSVREAAAAVSSSAPTASPLASSFDAPRGPCTRISIERPSFKATSNAGGSSTSVSSVSSDKATSNAGGAPAASAAASAKALDLANECCKASTPWNIYWVDTSVSHARASALGPLQKLNHFVDMTLICRKASAASVLNRNLRFSAQAFDFFPASWTLPKDQAELTRLMKAHKPPVLIVKPSKGSQGTGISICRNHEELQHVMQQNGRWAEGVAQMYIDRPLLLEGYKFDLRLYVLVTSCSPLRIHIYRDGLARLCTEKYQVVSSGEQLDLTAAAGIAAATSASDWRKRHLTNYAINKQHEDFTAGVGGAKRRLGHVFDTISREAGFDVDALWGDCQQLIVKTLIAVQPDLAHAYASCRPSHDAHPFSCFELLGFDLLIDQVRSPLMGLDCL